MPTGYTAKLMDKGQDFRSFVLTCARAMGACIMQREDPMDDLPKKQKPSDYHAKKLAETIKALAKLRAMTPSKQREYGNKLRDTAIATHTESKAKYRDEELRLEKMEAQIRAWRPPTADHLPLKEFMLGQIDISKHGVWYDKYLKEAQEKTAESYYIESLSNLVRDLHYHTDEHDKEAHAVNKRNAWIDKLYASLPK